MAIYPALLQGDASTADQADTTISTTAALPELSSSFEFDPDTEDFKRDGAGHISTANAEDAWAQWMTIAVRTPRRMPAYGGDYGIDEDRLLNMSYAAMVGELAAQITQTCMIHPLTASVGNFKFTKTATDAIACTFLVTSKTGAERTIDTTVRR